MGFNATASNASEIVVSLPKVDEDILNEDELLSYTVFSLPDADIMQHVEYIESMLLCMNILLGFCVGALFSLSFKAFV